MTHHTGEAWAEPVPLAYSDNLMDNRPATLYIMHSRITWRSTRKA